MGGFAAVGNAFSFLNPVVLPSPLARTCLFFKPLSLEIKLSTAQAWGFFLKRGGRPHIHPTPTPTPTLPHLTLPNPTLPICCSRPPQTAAERAGHNLNGFKDFRTETGSSQGHLGGAALAPTTPSLAAPTPRASRREQIPEKGLRPRPESGLDSLRCADFARHRLSR